MLDKPDKQIISELQRNGRATLSRIGEKVGMSYVAVGKRLNKLLKKRLVNVSAGVNANKLGMRIAVINAEVENYPRLLELVTLFKECPRVVFLLALSASNILSIMACEDMSTLESVVGVCSVRVHRGVRRSDVYVGGPSAYPAFLPLRVAMDRKVEVAPCGARCGECKSFQSNECVGCPATKFYRGSL